jgi:hypothetical protein
MKLSRIALACVCLFGLTQPTRGQDTEGSQKTAGPAQPGIPGYLDPRTGAFKPMAKVPLDESEIESVTATAGDFKVTFTITVKSSLPSTAVVSCTFSASTLEISSGLSMDDSMTVAATGTGSSRTCTLNMFYSWPLSSPSSDTVTLSYVISAVGTGSGTLDRTSTQTLPSIKGAPSGTTTKTVTATI